MWHFTFAMWRMRHDMWQWICIIIYIMHKDILSPVTCHLIPVTFHLSPVPCAGGRAASTLRHDTPPYLWAQSGFGELVKVWVYFLYPAYGRPFNLSTSADISTRWEWNKNYCNEGIVIVIVLTRWVWNVTVFTRLLLLWDARHCYYVD